MRKCRWWLRSAALRWVAGFSHISTFMAGATSSGQLRASASVIGTSLHTLVQMVAGGMGVTLLPKLAAEGGAIGLVLTPPRL